MGLETWGEGAFFLKPQVSSLRTHESPECAGFAREPAKLEDQVRFLAATLSFRFHDGMVDTAFVRCWRTAARAGERRDGLRPDANSSADAVENRQR